MVGMFSKEELQYRQSLPLSIKVSMTKTRIREFVNHYGTDDVYLSFSGGKDSTVLRHIIEQMYPGEITNVFLDTWMEFPQLRAFVKKQKNVFSIKPAGTAKDIVEKCGWCFPSKDVAETIYYARKDKKWAINKLNGLDKEGNYSQFRQQYRKWWFLVDADIKFSSLCCIEMKEKPVENYEKETGKKPILAIMASESARRKEAYLRTGCNSFDTKTILNEETGEEDVIKTQRPMSKPMGFWLENDVLQYIYENKLEIAGPYGTVTEAKELDGQMNLFDLGVTSNCQGCKFRTTGEERTGCMFCPVGGHLNNFSKIERVKKYNSDLYDYCMEELNEKKLIEFIRKYFKK